jgi:hypothetical protein
MLAFSFTGKKLSFRFRKHTKVTGVKLITLYNVHRITFYFAVEFFESFSTNMGSFSIGISIVKPVLFQ